MKIQIRDQNTANRWLNALGKKALVQHTFDTEGEFKALSAAELYARKQGYSTGSLDGKNPIGIAGPDYIVGKWHTIFSAQLIKLNGVIVSDDFKAGPCTFILFK
jgi:hypothetical protein